MRMRFCATMRRPAFSISALTAPVRLRAVASGLMIEKVRSVAMSFRPELTGSSGCGAYIGAPRPRQATLHRPERQELQQFHRDEPNLQYPWRTGSSLLA